MGLTLNGVDIQEVVLNGVDVQSIILNGVDIWSASSIVGICYLQASGTWSWHRVDKDGQPLTRSLNFNRIAPWNGITSVTIDGQTMVKIPKFYVKADTIADGPYAGAKARWVSSKLEDGFHIHPAFVRNGYVMDCIYIGAYEASIVGNLASSKPNVSPAEKTLPRMERPEMAPNALHPNHDDWLAYTRWRYQDIYDIAAINHLLLIELGTPDAQTAIGRGNVDTGTLRQTGSTNAVYRGIHEWWGNGDTFIDNTFWAADRAHNSFPLPSNQRDGSYPISFNYLNYWIRQWGQTSFLYSGGFLDTHDSNVDLNDLFLPVSANGTEANCLIPDFVSATSSSQDNNRYNSMALYSGGNNSDGANAGPFALKAVIYFDEGHDTVEGTCCARIAKDGAVTSEAAPNR